MGDLGGAGAGPVAFVQGTPTSGLTYTFTALAGAGDDVSGTGEATPRPYEEGGSFLVGATRWVARPSMYNRAHE